MGDNYKKTAQGYVVFDSFDAVEAALRMNNSSILDEDDRTTLLLRVDYAKPTIDSSRSVFVGNLKYSANEMTLREHFTNGCEWGINDDMDVVKGVRIIRDATTMQCKGFGYVLLKDKS